MLIYMQMSLPTNIFKNSQSANDSRSKQPNFKYTTVVLIWKYCKYELFLQLKSFNHNVSYILPYINILQIS